MGSYTVHEVGTATEPFQPRTFIKITFSFDRFAMAGNSLNLLFKDEYSNPSSPWVWKLRGKGRNSTSK
ncbi:MAG: hypothetical protein L6Q37_09065 [Bdellovibrionaceae bacterium]|nr:hypothetical protein [Pseudobdellovibrionaceae bacterium]NUM58261.1 hypothetical protein [Pseudobdellovibrionaceae bacterium]